MSHEGITPRDDIDSCEASHAAVVEARKKYDAVPTDENQTAWAMACLIHVARLMEMLGAMARDTAEEVKR